METFIVVAYRFFEDPITQTKQVMADVVRSSDVHVMTFPTEEAAQEHMISEECFDQYVVVRVEE